MQLGKVVASDSHLQYRCRVYAPDEIDRPPAASDFALGTFVSLPTGSQQALIGVICDTVLQNPAFGAYGPRLSTPDETGVFSPDYVDEVFTVVTIVAIGHVDDRGAHHEASPVAPAVNCEVLGLTTDEVRTFHRSDDGLRIGYLPLLLSMARSAPVISQAVLKVLADLQVLFPDEPDRTRLHLLSQSLAWRMRVMSLS